jgi:hypothetical protein
MTASLWNEASSNGSEKASYPLLMHVPFFETSWLTCEHEDLPTIAKFGTLIKRGHTRPVPPPPPPPP